MTDTPPRPETDLEWEIHWAFHRLNITERDYARVQVRRLEARVAELGHEVDRWKAAHRERRG